jgi:hypothetical protein
LIATELAKNAINARLKFSLISPQCKVSIWRSPSPHQIDIEAQHLFEMTMERESDLTCSK